MRARVAPYRRKARLKPCNSAAHQPQTQVLIADSGFQWVGAEAKLWIEKQVGVGFGEPRASVGCHTTIENFVWLLADQIPQPSQVKSVSQEQMFEPVLWKLSRVNPAKPKCVAGRTKTWNWEEKGRHSQFAKMWHHFFSFSDQSTKSLCLVCNCNIETENVRCQHKRWSKLPSRIKMQLWEKLHILITSFRPEIGHCGLQIQCKESYKDEHIPVEDASGCHKWTKKCTQKCSFIDSVNLKLHPRGERRSFDVAHKRKNILAFCCGLQQTKIAQEQQSREAFSCFLLRTKEIGWHLWRGSFVISGIVFNLLLCLSKMAR